MCAEGHGIHFFLEATTSLGKKSYFGIEHCGPPGPTAALGASPHGCGACDAAWSRSGS